MQAPIPVSDAFVALAGRMADEAGAVLHRYYRTGLSPERKADESPVTLADQEVEKVIRALIEKEAPEHGIFGEEFGLLRPEAKWQWVIDPIDGTRAFMAGYPLFTTLIALCYEGTPVLGVIDQPILDERWVGIRGMAKGGVRPCPALSKAVVATTSADHFTSGQDAAFAALMKASAHKVSGGDAYAYAMLASGQLDVVVDAGMKPYDYCALVPVIEAAGGVISDWKGKPLRIDSDGSVLASANAGIHAQALAILSAA